MKEEEIIKSGIYQAIERGSTLKQAVQSFLNAGYSENLVKQIASQIKPSDKSSEKKQDLYQSSLPKPPQNPKLQQKNQKQPQETQKKSDKNETTKETNKAAFILGLIAALIHLAISTYLFIKAASVQTILENIAKPYITQQIQTQVSSTISSLVPTISTYLNLIATYIFILSFIVLASAFLAGFKNRKTGGLIMLIAAIFSINPLALLAALLALVFGKTKEIKE